MDALAVRCPQCNNRLCDALPGGSVAGHFKCRCRLELLIEYTALSELQLIVVPPELTAALAPVVWKRLTDGRGLVRWADYLACVRKEGKERK
jgi:hypothetical protein